MVAHGQRGLSLVELLVGLVVLSVLVSVAAPSFSRMVAEQRLRQVGSELRISLATARSEAVKRNEAVSLIKQGSDWSTGWCIEAGKTSNCSAQPIQQFNVASDQITVLKDGAAAGTEINFNAWGRVTSCPEFLLTTTAGGSACALCLVVTTDGRVESHTGSCPEADACTTEGSDMSWAGACS